MRGAKAKLSGHVWPLCHLLAVMHRVLAWSGSAANLEIRCMPVSDPESSHPTTCVGAEVASTHFSRGPVGLRSCWDLAASVGDVGKAGVRLPQLENWLGAAAESPLVKACRLKIKTRSVPSQRRWHLTFCKWQLEV